MLLLQGCALLTCKFHMIEGQRGFKILQEVQFLALSKLKR